MTVNKQFEAYKVKREIKRSGSEFEFFRRQKNEFNEPVKDSGQSLGKIKCLYHEISNHVILTTKEAAQVRLNETNRGKQPALLCLYDDANSLSLLVDDYVTINEKTFIVTGIRNIQEWNIIADISLQGVDDGINVSL